METYQQIEMWLKEGRSHAWVGRQTGLTRARIGQIAQQLGAEPMAVTVHIHAQGAVITGPYESDVIAERVLQALKLAKIDAHLASHD